MRRSIIFFAFGVAVTAAFAFAGMWGQREKFKREAVEHYAAVWARSDECRVSSVECKNRWMWIDDWYVMELQRLQRRDGAAHRAAATGNWEKL